VGGDVGWGERGEGVCCVGDWGTTSSAGVARAMYGGGVLFFWGGGVVCVGG
jgi:hypothetical protein